MKNFEWLDCDIGKMKVTERMTHRLTLWELRFWTRMPTAYSFFRTLYDTPFAYKQIETLLSLSFFFYISIVLIRN